MVDDVQDWIEAVGPGWQPLVRDLDARLRQIDPDYKILQIKEKFGGLRVYFMPSLTHKPDTMDADNFRIKHMQALVQAIEAESFYICENCGTKENVETKATRFWTRTLCPSCREKDRARTP